MCLQEEDGKRRPPAGRHSRGCGAAVGIPRKSRRYGLPRIEPEPGGPPFCGLGGRGLSQGSGPAPFPSCSLHSSCWSFLSAPAGRANSAPSRDRAGARPRVPSLFPTLATRPLPPAPGPTIVAEMAGSWKPGPQPDFPFSPGLPNSVPDLSWRKPIYPNGE